MSSLVLLDGEGAVARKLQLVSLPEDYVVPEGMTVSWRSDLRASSSDPFAVLHGPPEQVEAYFYLGNAWGQVCRDGFKGYERDDQQRMRFGSRDLTITVQGTSAKDVMELRDRIMQLINSGDRWEVSNDLNPKKSLVRRLMGR